MYNATPNDTLTFTDGNATEVTLGTAMTDVNITANGNEITIIEPGDYEISYVLTVTSTAGANNVEFGVRQNDVDITATEVTKNLTSNTPITFSGNVILNLGATDTIDMQLTNPAASGDVAINEATLVVKKLSTATPTN